MSDMKWEEYRDRCLKAGDTAENAKRTWDLMEDIKRILNNEDVSPFTPPEYTLNQEVRLARLFIDRNQAMVAKDDETIAKWLESLGGMIDGNLGRAERDIATAIREKKHWKWWHNQGKS